MSAKQLPLLLILSVTTTACGLLDPDDECSLRMLAAAVGSLAFVGDQLDFEADWEGDPDDCPTNFTWQLSGGLSATSALTGQRLTVRANTAGPGTITLFAGTNNRYSFKQDFTIRRSTSDIDLSFLGLPTGLNGTVDLNGPNGFTRTLNTTGLVRDVVAGSYSYTARTFTGGSLNHRWGPTQPTGSFTLGRDERYSLSVGYTRQTGQVDFEAFGVDPSFTGNFGQLVGAPGSISLIAPKISFAAEPGSYTWSANSLDPGGYNYTPQLSSGSFTLNPLVTQTLNFNYTATRGRFDATLQNAPAGATMQGTVTRQGGSPQNFTIPGTGYWMPGAFTLGLPSSFTHRNLSENRDEGWVPQQLTYPYTLQAGQRTQVAVPVRMQQWDADYDGAITVKTNPFNHPLGFSPTTRLHVKVVIDQSSTENVTITGPFPWLAVSGTRQSNGALSATGTGMIFSFSNVPATFTGTLANDGSLTGDYELGRNTAPTGLPGGSITFGTVLQRVRLF